MSLWKRKIVVARQHIQIHTHEQDDTIPIPYEVTPKDSLTVTIIYKGHGAFTRIECPVELSWQTISHIRALTEMAPHDILDGLLTHLTACMVGKDTEEKNPFFALNDSPTVSPSVEPEETILTVLLRRYFDGKERLTEEPVGATGPAFNYGKFVLQTILQKLRELNITPSSPASLAMPAWLAAQGQDPSHE